MLGAERCDRVSVVDLNDDEVIESVELERDPDVGLRSMTFFAVDAQVLAA